MPTTVASRIAEACTAARQGLASEAQLAAAGVGSTTLWRAVQQGLLVRVRRGVYLLGPRPRGGRHLLTDGVVDLSYLAKVREALLSLGADAVADRRTSAVLWCMDMVVEPKLVEVRVPRTQTRASLTGVRAVQPSDRFRGAGGGWP